MQLLCGRFTLDLTSPVIMGIVNLTPDSFSGDGRLGDVDAAISHARHQWAQGAQVLDVGAESTRPGSPPVPLEEELRRLLPVIEELASWGVPISVDTYKPEVMRAVLAKGVDMINDIRALSEQDALAAVLPHRAAVCLMHMQGDPETMQNAPAYRDVVAEVRKYLSARVQACLGAGMDPARIVVDPGFGFGKSTMHNYALLHALPDFAQWPYEGAAAADAGKSFPLPLLAGMSRKSMIGAVTGRPVEDRLAGSVAAALLAAERGAHILRVHDVAATRDALAVLRALNDAGNVPTTQEND